MSTKKPQQGELWFADLAPVQGSEQGGIRPILIISGDTMNGALPMVIGCPLSTKVKKYPGTLLLSPTKKNGLAEPSEIMTFQICALTQKRLKKRIGVISINDMQMTLSLLQDVLTL